MSSDRSDLELLEAWRGGDLEAADVLVQRHFDRLYRFFHRRIDDGVADLVQRTWAACVEKRDHIPDAAGFKPFLFGIARKELLMHLRKHQRGEQALAKLGSGDLAPTSLSQIISAREHTKLLRWALRRIPLESQLVLELFYWEELGVEGVAEVLEIPAGTVKSRLHRARAQLRDEMASAGAAIDLVDTTMHALVSCDPPEG